MGLLDNIFGKGGNDNDNKKSKSKPSAAAVLSNPFGGRKTFQGAGQSLGGSKPGIVIPIVLSDPGPLGVRVEKQPNSLGTAIVSDVVSGTQAQAAGLQRGDIVCFAGSNGQEEIMYDMFLELAQSSQRPLHFEVRRIPATTASSTNNQNSGTKSNSAAADHRRQAVIAAAEAREMAHKQKTKPIRQVTRTTLEREKLQQQQQQQMAAAASANNNVDDMAPMSEESKRAAAAAKQGERQLAQQLGYNPYEPARATAGQARTATTTAQHGSINAEGAGGGAGAGQTTTLPTVAPPAQPTTPAESNDDDYDGNGYSFPIEPSEEFSQALATMLSSSSQTIVASSCTIMSKLLINATTKGQAKGEDSAKFRRVRLENAKIKAALVDVPGAIEVMLATGFQLDEQDGESVLVFPANNTGPEWLPTALKQMEHAAAASN